MLEILWASLTGSRSLRALSALLFQNGVSSFAGWCRTAMKGSVPRVPAVKRAQTRGVTVQTEAQSHVGSRANASRIL